MRRQQVKQRHKISFGSQLVAQFSDDQLQFTELLQLHIPCLYRHWDTFMPIVANVRHYGCSSYNINSMSKNTKLNQLLGRICLMQLGH